MVEAAVRTEAMVETDGLSDLKLFWAFPWLLRIIAGFCDSGGWASPKKNESKFKLPSISRLKHF